MGIGTFLIAATALAPAADAAPQPGLTIAVGGDVQFGRYRHGKLSIHSGEAPFAAFVEHLRQADLTFVNLENPVSDRDVRDLKPRPWTYRLRAPTSVAPLLRDAGIDGVSVANNHSYDLGLPGMRDTVATLTKSGITPVGISFTGSPIGPAVLLARDTRVHLFACTTFVNRKPAPREQLALCTIDELEGKIAARISALRQAEPDSVILISLHWGMEGEGSPRDYHLRAGRRLVEAGATIVAGHHTHVFNPVEVHGDGVILYNLGNLLFDMPEEETRRAAIATVELGHAKTGWRVDTVRLIPVWRAPDSKAPLPAPAAETAALFDRILPEARDRLATSFVLEGGVAVWRRPPPTIPAAP